MANPSRLFDATSLGRIDVVDRLLSGGADPDEPGPNGWTPLMLAAMGRHEVIAARLLDAGANVNATAQDGSTALIEAALWGGAEMVALLLRRGADHSAVNADGWTAAAIADAKGHDAIARLLENAPRPTRQPGLKEGGM